MIRAIVWASLAAVLLSVPATGAGPAGQEAGRGAVPDARGAIEALQARILERNAEGTLDNRRARRALRNLDEIRRVDAAYRRDGSPPTAAQAGDILSRLDALRADLSEGPVHRPMARDER